MIPNPPLTTLAPLGRWLENLRTHVNRQKIIKGSGYGIKEHTNGVELILPQSGGGGGGTTLKRFWVTGVENDYLVCVPYGLRDGYTADDVVNVAKPHNVRDKPAGTIDGSYRYDGERQHRFYRVAAPVADGFIEIEEELRPGYNNTAIKSIFAFIPEGGGAYAATESDQSDVVLEDADGNPIIWQDANIEGNNWFPTYGTFTVCINKALHSAVFAAGTPEANVS